MDELVKALRFCETHATCRECVFCPKNAEDMRCNNLLMQAADAIEQLTVDLERSKEWETFWEKEANEALKKFQTTVASILRWIPVEEQLPGDFVSVQAHMTDAGNFPPVREAYVVNKNWFFPALKEFHPVDMWKRFDEPPKEET